MIAGSGWNELFLLTFFYSSG